MEIPYTGKAWFHPNCSQCGEDLTHYVHFNQEHYEKHGTNHVLIDPHICDGTDDSCPSNCAGVTEGEVSRWLHIMQRCYQTDRLCHAMEWAQVEEEMRKVVKE